MARIRELRFDAEKDLGTYDSSRWGFSNNLRYQRYQADTVDFGSRAEKLGESLPLDLLVSSEGEIPRHAHCRDRQGLHMEAGIPSALRIPLDTHNMRAQAWRIYNDHLGDEGPIPTVRMLPWTLHLSRSMRSATIRRVAWIPPDDGVS